MLESAVLGRSGLMSVSQIIRLVLATGVLVNSVGSAPAFGHAHGQRHSARLDDHGRRSPHHHSHSPMWSEECELFRHTATFSDCVFHLHGAWFGLVFNLPNPPGRPNGDRRSQIALHDETCPGLTKILPAAHAELARGAVVWLQVLIPEGRTGADLRPSAHLFPARHFLSEAETSCALRAGAGVLRC